MPRYVAFLRAVNVGGRIVKMDELRRHVEAAGFDEVETFIASGNVILSSPSKSVPAIEAQIEARLKKALGYDVPTFARTTAGVIEIAEREVFSAQALGKAQSLQIGMTRGRIDVAAAKRLAALDTQEYTFRTAGSEVYWLLNQKMSLLKLRPAQIERALGAPVTFRAASSLAKLVATHCR